MYEDIWYFVWELDCTSGEAKVVYHSASKGRAKQYIEDNWSDVNPKTLMLEKKEFIIE